MVSYTMVPQPETELDMKPQTALHVQENQVASPDTVVYPDPPAQHAHQPFRKRLGTWSIGVLVSSTLVIFAVMIFLVFLWRSGTDDLSRGYGWAHAIALSSATLKVITLSSVVLRLAVAFQAGLCTSMAAALILERNKVPLPDLLHFAALRSISSSPPTILYPIGRQIRFYIRSAPAILIIWIFITTTVLQLTSFFLVIDTDTVSLPGPVYNPRMPFTNNNDTEELVLARRSNINYWGSRPLAYYPFGEIQSGSKQAENMHDTGAIFQGMFPAITFTMSNPNWIRDTRRLDTVTTVLASRVACVAPTIEATIQQNENDLYSYLVGNVTIDRTVISPLRCLSNEPSDCVITFNCSLPTVYDYLSNTGAEQQVSSASDWISGVCAIQQGAWWSFGESLFNTANSTVNSTDALDEQGILADITMVLNHTGLTAMRPNSTTKFSSILNGSKKGQEWSTYDLKEDDSVDLSLCFSKFESEHKYVQLRTNRTIYPPQISWDVQNGKYNTFSVQRLFDVSNELYNNVTYDKPRPIMEMEMPRFDDTKIPAGSVTRFSSFSGLQFFDIASTKAEARPMLPGCFRCTGGKAISLHPQISTLFQDILKRTRRPAFALQALFSVVTQSAYYEDASTFNVDYESTFVQTEDAIVPFQFFGIYIIAALLAFHLLLVAWMVYLFARRTKYSMVGEMWHSMGQVMEHVPDRLLSESMGRTDVEIRKALKRSDTDRSGVSVYRDAEVAEGQVRERK